jgi:hypothetical protein
MRRESAVETACKSLRDLRIAEVTELDLKVENNKVVAFRTKLKLSFKYDPGVQKNGTSSEACIPPRAARSAPFAHGGVPDAGRSDAEHARVQTHAGDGPEQFVHPRIPFRKA